MKQSFKPTFFNNIIKNTSRYYNNNKYNFDNKYNLDNLEFINRYNKLRYSNNSNHNDNYLKKFTQDKKTTLNVHQTPKNIKKNFNVTMTIITTASILANIMLAHSIMYNYLIVNFP